MEGNVDRVDCNERVKKMFEAGAMTSIRVTHTERKRAHWHTDTHSHLDGGANDRQMAKVDVATSQSVAIGRRRSFCPENQNLILPDAVRLICLTNESCVLTDIFRRKVRIKIKFSSNCGVRDSREQQLTSGGLLHDLIIDVIHTRWLSSCGNVLAANARSALFREKKNNFIQIYWDVCNGGNDYHFPLIEFTCR